MWSACNTNSLISSSRRLRLKLQGHCHLILLFIYLFFLARPAVSIGQAVTPTAPPVALNWRAARLGRWRCGTCSWCVGNKTGGRSACIPGGLHFKKWHRSPMLWRCEEKTHSPRCINKESCAERCQACVSCPGMRAARQPQELFLTYLSFHSVWRGCAARAP